MYVMSMSRGLLSACVDVPSISTLNFEARESRFDSLIPHLNATKCSEGPLLQGSRGKVIFGCLIYVEMFL